MTSLASVGEEGLRQEVRWVKSILSVSGWGRGKVMTMMFKSERLFFSVA